MISKGNATGAGGGHNDYFSKLNAILRKSGPGHPVIVLDLDDYIFLRPTQSESVMLQFGDLIVIRGGQRVDRWPVFSQGS